MSYGMFAWAIYGSDKVRKSQGARTSIDPVEDELTVTKALEFRDAAKRDGRLYVCALVPRWKAPLLRLLGIPYEEKV